ncbi:MAG: Yip1 family protein [Euryarchaeota archaeon]|nr:Yip1 family protein [Euryarchaeota archaeon]
MPSLQQALPIRIVSFFRQLRLLLFLPDRFFAGRSARSGDLKIPFLIVFGLALVHIGGEYGMVTALIRSLDIGNPSMYSIIYLNLFAIILSPFLMWVYYSAVFYGISYLYKGQGTFFRTLAYVGYGCVPLIIGILLLLIIFQYISIPVQDYFMPSHVAAHRVIKSLINAGITIFVLLWSGFIWTSGMRHARGLSLRQAGVTVFVPVGLAIFIEIWWLLIKLIV